jgi:peptide deformylase
LKLYYYGHEHVMAPSNPRVEPGEHLEGLRDKMIAMMIRHELNGLSAPQMGIPKQMVVVKLHDGTYLDLINPYITKMYGAEENELETCISCPPHDNGCLVPRMKTIHVTACTVGNLYDPFNTRFDGQDARVVQHEVDHLDGTFFFHRASIVDRVNTIKRFKTWRHEWKLANAMKGEPWQRHQ